MTFVTVFYGLGAVGLTGILLTAKTPIQRGPRAPKVIVKSENFAQSSGSPVGYV